MCTGSNRWKEPDETSSCHLDPSSLHRLPGRVGYCQAAPDCAICGLGEGWPVVFINGALLTRTGSPPVMNLRLGDTMQCVLSMVRVRSTSQPHHQQAQNQHPLLSAQERQSSILTSATKPPPTEAHLIIKTLTCHSLGFPKRLGHSSKSLFLHHPQSDETFMHNHPDLSPYHSAVI